MPADAGRPATLAGVNRILLGDNLPLLRAEPDASVTLAYLDPPFNTGRAQARRTLATVADPDGDRTGFGGRRYAAALLQTSPPTATRSTTTSASSSRGCARSTGCSRPTGTLYFHIDYREAHYCKLLLDELFGRECFLNELIWAYDYGAKPRNRWPAKHDTILVYVKDPARYLFDADAVDREPYMAPGLVTPEQRERGKRPTDVMVAHDRLPHRAARRPATRRRSPRASCAASCRPPSRPGDLCLDPFAGSGTLGAVAARARPPLPADRRVARGGRGDASAGSALRPRPEGPTRTRASASPSGVDGRRAARSTRGRSRSSRPRRGPRRACESTSPSMRRSSSACGGIVWRRICSKYGERGPLVESISVGDPGRR